MRLVFKVRHLLLRDLTYWFLERKAVVVFFLGLLLPFVKGLFNLRVKLLLRFRFVLIFPFELAFILITLVLLILVRVKPLSHRVKFCGGLVVCGDLILFVVAILLLSIVL